MKIAYITKDFPKLSQTFILHKVFELMRLGHEVTVFTRSIRHPHAHPDLAAMHEFKPRIVRIPVPDRVRPKDLVRGMAKSSPRIDLMVESARKASKIDHPSTPLMAWNKSLPFLRGKFDIIHAHLAELGREYLEIMQILGIPMVVNFRGSDVAIDVARWPDRYQPLFQKAPRFIAISENTKRLAANYGCDPARISVIPTEVDSSYFEFYDRINRGESIPLIITVARFHWIKGLNYALEAMALLKKSGVKFRYLVLGGGDRLDELMMAIRDLDLNDHVELAGEKDRQGVREALYSSHIFLMPSLFEGLCTSVLEAQATGLPVVATRVGGLPEAVKQGETGFLVPSRDPAALAERLRFLIEHPQERLEMGRKGRAWIEQNFSMDRLIPELIGLYKEVIQEWGARKASR